MKQSLLDVEKIFEVVETLTNGERGRDLISPPPPSSLSQQQKWGRIINFMRKNPKLLFEALPDNEPVKFGISMFDREEDIIPAKIAYISKSPIKNLSKTT